MLNHTCWIGTPGISKSVGQMSVLMELLFHLGEEGWPAKVGLRVPYELTVFERQSESDDISITQYSDVDLVKLTRLSKQFDALVLDLAEKEEDPSTMCVTFVSLSNAMCSTPLRLL